ncbi:MAG: glucuronate isomerase [Bacteroidota bacterium]
MKAFLDEDFLLQTKTASRLYHDYAKEQPIIDYHCHLSPKDIAENRVFDTISEAWLAGDHYKWRAMRTNGVAEKYCTGDAPDKDKFQAWAETVPYTLRNPLYHWTHLELQRYFGVSDLLDGKSADRIYDVCNEQLPNLSTQQILQKMKVEVVCSTDDPTDSLEHHEDWAQNGSGLQLLPTFRPDKVLFTSDVSAWNAYVDRLSEASGVEISTYANLLEALKNRHDFFASKGCKLSDAGLERLYASEFTEQEATDVFASLRKGKAVSAEDGDKYRSAVLLELGRMHYEKGWTQQYHLGALRNNNSRMLGKLGLDTGFDSMGDFPQARALSTFLDRLDGTDQLAKTILYNLNPTDNAVFATMVGNFNDGSIAGKVQFGSGWWFLDQKLGMEEQMNNLSNMGLLSRFVGMLTDSRSFLSFPRHEYFRRVLCNLIGTDVENGELPNDMDLLGGMVENICYGNAKQFFQF